MNVMANSLMIFTNRTVAMQRLSDAIAHGYTQYCSGSISQDRCAKLVRKFDMNYAALADRNERARRKRAGLGNANLVLWLTNDVVRWWLLVTPPSAGDHAAHALEKLCDATSKNGRIEIDRFELVRLPKTPVQNDSNKKQANKLSQRYQPKLTKLTWRMAEHKNQAWRDSIIESVRNSSDRSLEVLIYQLWSSPGFSGIRSQIGKLAALYRAEVKRSGRKGAPALPKRLGYVRRLRNNGISLAQLALQARNLAATRPSSDSNTNQISTTPPCFAASVVSDQSI